MSPTFWQDYWNIEFRQIFILDKKGPSVFYSFICTSVTAIAQYFCNNT